MEGHRRRFRTCIYSVRKSPENHTGIVSFTIDGVHPHDVSEILSSDGIDVRAGHHCAQPLLEYLGVRSSTRASLMFYNTPEEVDRTDRKCIHNQKENGLWRVEDFYNEILDGAQSASGIQA